MLKRIEERGPWGTSAVVDLFMGVLSSTLISNYLLFKNLDVSWIIGLEMFNCSIF